MGGSVPGECLGGSPQGPTEVLPIGLSVKGHSPQRSRHPWGAECYPWDLHGRSPSQVKGLALGEPCSVGRKRENYRVETSA